MVEWFLIKKISEDKILNMKKYLLLLLFAPMLNELKAQVSIQPVLPLAGMVQKNNLWNIAIVNTSNANYDCRIELTIRDRASGLEVLTATTGQFQLATGAKQLNASLLAPLQYNYISTTATRRDDFIPIGNYIACYRLTANSKLALAEECVAFDVEPLSPPMLITPADNAVLEVAPSQFSWIPPAPMNLFSRLDYEVVIAEIQAGQKPEEAIQQNLPFYREPNVTINNLAYKGTVNNFEKDKWYAWQVVAKDDRSYAGKSEVWVFSVHNDPIEKMIVEQAPYIKMKKDVPEKGIAPNGILKLSYINETTDSIAKIRIIDLSVTDKKQDQVFTVALSAGENLIEANLKKKFHVEKGRLYEAQIINSRNEKWVMQFEVYQYEPKK
jgi:hypothetical protein